MAQKLIAKGLAFGMFFTNAPMYSFANEVSLEQNKYAKEISNIETKEDLQKSAQKAVKAGEIDTWITGLTNMPTARERLTGAVVNNKIYCIGGQTSSSTYINKVEVYDPATNSWETKAPMPTTRSYLTSEVVDGKIYCIGGQNSTSNYLNTLEVYDPATNSWETKSPMPTRRGYLTSTVVDGKIYCIGGQNSTSYFNRVEVYDPATDSWETKTPMPTKRYTLTSEAVNGKIYCIGGTNGSSYYNTVEVYDPATDSWETKTSMPTSRGYLASAEVNGKIYCIGGVNTHYTNKVEVYDPATDSWETKTSTPIYRRTFASAVINGKIYCIGGYDGSSRLNTVEAYVAFIPPTQEEIAEEAVVKAEQTKDPTDIDNARDLVNQLPESPKKDELNDRLDALLPPTPQKISANIDVYITMSNTLSLSLDTNSVTFEDFSGVEDMEKLNAVNLTVESSLPYEINASLEGEIQNADKTEVIDRSILGIRANDDVDYKSFVGINTYLNLVDNQEAGKVNTHGIDLRLNKNVTYKTDVYKTVIKFEVKQK